MKSDILYILLNTEGLNF